MRPSYTKLILVVSAIALLFFVGGDVVMANDDSLITSVKILLVCGDGKVEGLEVCDPGDPPQFPVNVNGLTCQDFGWESGDLGCLPDCSDYDTSNCYTCGNGTREPVEECEGNDFGGKSCVTFGFDEGSLFCTNECKISTVNCIVRPRPSSGGGGGGTRGGAPASDTGFIPGSEVPPGETKVIVTGKSYPESDVHILKDGKVIGIVRTDTKADFYFETSEIPAGITSFGFWSQDPTGLKSTLLSLTFRVVSGAVTNISGVYLSPTIEVNKKSVQKGEDIKIYGSTVPQTEIKVFIHSDEEIVAKASSTEKGSWSLDFNTEPLSVDFHTAKAQFEANVSGNVVRSGFSRIVSFYVGRAGAEPVCAEADLNGDGRVNLTDFSILLFYWGTDNECADQNQNGTVDLIDFSIMMYYWTG